MDRICFAEHRKSIALRCPASRKPGAAVSGRPFDACVSPMEAAAKTSCFDAPENKHRSTESKANATLRISNPATGLLDTAAATVFLRNGCGINVLRS